MISRKTFLLGTIGAFLAGGVLGLLIGGYGGYRAGVALVLNSALDRDAREVGVRIAVLDALRTGDTDRAISDIEKGMDDLLIGFDPVDPYPGVNGATIAAMDKAIDEARAYRQVHPWPAEQNQGRANMVRALFARER